jgi:hypothetical protein
VAASNELEVSKAGYFFCPVVICAKKGHIMFGHDVIDNTFLANLKFHHKVILLPIHESIYLVIIWVVKDQT